jgi:hypothetical protein
MPRSSRDYHLNQRFGLSSEKVEALVREQSGLCALCRIAPAIHVDHDHATGRVRAILCEACNGGLGLFRDDPQIIRRAIEYLEKAPQAILEQMAHEMHPLFTRPSS